MFKTKMVRITSMLLCTALVASMSTFVVNASSVCNEMQSVSDDEFNEIYPEEYFLEAECFEDDDGNLVFERTTVVESNSRLRVSNSERQYVTDDVVLFDLSEDEKEEIIQYVQEQKALAIDSRSSGETPINIIGIPAELVKLIYVFIIR